jgi:hypothetical protein
VLKCIFNRISNTFYVITSNAVYRSCFISAMVSISTHYSKNLSFSLENTSLPTLYPHHQLHYNLPSKAWYVIDACIFSFFLIKKKNFDFLVPSLIYLTVLTTMVIGAINYDQAKQSPVPFFTIGAVLFCIYRSYNCSLLVEISLTRFLH